jgi:hypothetical protein
MERENRKEKLKRENRKEETEKIKPKKEKENRKKKTEKRTGTCLSKPAAKIKTLKWLKEA